MAHEKANRERYCQLKAIFMKNESKNLVSDTYISFIHEDKTNQPKISEKNTHSNKLSA
jgi:hypothetical protein